MKAKDGAFFVTDWLRNRNTLEYIGIWEQLTNPGFNYGEFAIIKTKKLSLKMINWHTSTPPKAPFYASIFNYYLSDDLEGYEAYDTETLALVQQIPGYLGYESMKHEGRGTFISYWQSKEAIAEWAKNPIHQHAKQLGQGKWYRYYHSMIAEVNSFHSHAF